MSTTTTPVTNINFSSESPAPPTGQQNIVWSDDSSGDISGYLPAFEGDSGSGGLAGAVPAPAAGTAAANKFLRADGTWAAPSGSGVTSVGVSVSSVLTVSGTPVTTSGTIALGLATQSPNLVLAGPVSGTVGATPTFRALVAADLPAGTSGTSISLETNGTANASQTTLNLVAGNSVTLTSDSAGDVTVALNSTVNATTVNTTTVSASGAVAAASFSASGDITTSTSHTGTATVTGGLSVAGAISSSTLATSGAAGVTASYTSTGNGGTITATNGTTSGYMIVQGSSAFSSTFDNALFCEVASSSANITSPFVISTASNASGGSGGNILLAPNRSVVATVSGGGVSVAGTVTAANFAGSGSPTLTAGATTVTGTSPSIAVYGSNSSGEVDFTVGTSPSASGTIATITFSTAYPSAPKAVFVGNGTSVPTGLGWSTSTTGITLTCSAALTAGSYFKLAYMIIA